MLRKYPTALILLALLGGAAHAHDFTVRDAVAVLKADGTYWVDLRVDLDALALGVPPASDDAELVAALEAMSYAALELAQDRARETLGRRVRIRFDGEPVEARIEFPEQGEIASPPSVLGTIARFSGRRPPGAMRFSFSASRAFGTVDLTVLDARHIRGVRHLLAPGARSPEVSLDGGDATDGAPGFGAAVWSGFLHVLPKGVDHILFTLGLFLLSRRLRPLLLQVTAFTLAHTATLALSTMGVVSLPGRPVETAIALSIVWVGIENLWTERLHPWRPAVVFGFGLLHGLGFAGAFRETGLADGNLARTLVGFNVGVEVAQLTVVGIAWVVFAGVAEPRYRRLVVVPGSLAIAVVGAYWAVTRGFGLS